MLSYYGKLAIRSLMRNVALTTIIVATLSIGIGASMMMLTILRAMSSNPIPEKAQQLFAPQIDNWGPNKPGERTPDDLMHQLSFMDASALLTARGAVRQSAMYGTRLTVVPPGQHGSPFRVRARAAYADFFSMFAVPFLYGGPWGRVEDENRNAVVVITRKLNDRLFDGANSVGATIDLNGHSYRVLGVLERWQPTPHFFDLDAGAFGETEDVFLPLTRALDAHLRPSGNVMCKDSPPSAWEELLRSECLWLQMWVELPSAAEATAYRSLLNSYAADQRRVGRFDWPPHTRLRNVSQWLQYRRVVSNEVRILVLIAFSFLGVCLLNAMGLMLAKNLGRAGEIGIRRALGASRRSILAQCFVEAAVIGVVGGVIGLLLTGLGFLGLRAVLSENAFQATSVDLVGLGITMVLAVASAFAAGLYPAWRLSQVQPALQLKAE